MIEKIHFINIAIINLMSLANKQKHWMRHPPWYAVVRLFREPLLCLFLSFGSGVEPSDTVDVSATHSTTASQDDVLPDGSWTWSPVDEGPWSSFGDSPLAELLEALDEFTISEFSFEKTSSFETDPLVGALLSKWTLPFGGDDFFFGEWLWVFSSVPDAAMPAPDASFICSSAGLLFVVVGVLSSMGM